MKDKIFKSPNSDMEVEVFESGWIAIRDEYGATITIGVPPNARTDLILKALEYAQGNKK